MDIGKEIENLTLEELRERWEELHGGIAPPNVSLRLLRLLYTQRVREDAEGGIPDWAIEELDRILAECRAPKTQKGNDRGRSQLAVGTRLVREWNGITISVEVKEEGYLYGDRLYGSLSEIAREITGARWSGPRFFRIRGCG